MVITYHGGECFKVSFGETTLAFNPISKESKFKEVKFGADVALVTLNHEDFNGIDQVTYGERRPFVIDGPGEYEVGEVSVHGFAVPTKYDEGDCLNTVYQVLLEGMNMLFVGALPSEKLDASILGELGEIDILFVPVGGSSDTTTLLDASGAAALGVKLEARVIIPMHYDEKTLKTFLKEVGADVKPQEKLTVKKKDLLTMEGAVVVLGS